MFLTKTRCIRIQQSYPEIALAILILLALAEKVLCLLKIESSVNKPFVEDTRLMQRLENDGDVSHRPVVQNYFTGIRQFGGAVFRWIFVQR